MNQCRIGRDKLLEFVEHSQPRGRMLIHNRTAFDEVGCQFGISRIQNAKASRPPLASGIDVGARIQKGVDDLASASSGRKDNGGRVKRKQWIVDLRLQPGVTLDQLREGVPIAGEYGRPDLFDDMRFHALIFITSESRKERTAGTLLCSQFCYRNTIWPRRPRDKIVSNKSRFERGNPLQVFVSSVDVCCKSVDITDRCRKGESNANPFKFNFQPVRYQRSGLLPAPCRRCVCTV